MMFEEWWKEHGAKASGDDIRLNTCCKRSAQMAWQAALLDGREGYVCVPKQWTSEMAHAGYEVHKHPDIQCSECGEIYTAMIKQALAAAKGEGK